MRLKKWSELTRADKKRGLLWGAISGALVIAIVFGGAGIVMLMIENDVGTERTLQWRGDILGVLVYPEGYAVLGHNSTSDEARIFYLDRNASEVVIVKGTYDFYMQIEVVDVSMVGVLLHTEYILYV